MTLQYILHEIIRVAAVNKGKHSIMDILGYKPDEFDRAHEIANKLKKDGYVSNVVCSKNDIQFELGSKGFEYYDAFIGRGR